MREIKFRAWDKKHKRMRGEVLSICWVDSFHCSREIHVRSSYPHPNTYPLDNMELMQFTGLFDKNGKEIWEGDILWGEDDSKVEILWENACVQMKDESGDSWLAADHCKYWEVIGNIYENQELLTSAP